jgi:hypothetical protein
VLIIFGHGPVRTTLSSKLLSAQVKDISHVLNTFCQPLDVGTIGIVFPVTKELRNGLLDNYKRNTENVICGKTWQKHIGRASSSYNF